MDKQIILVKSGGESCYEEKKSRFLGKVYSVNSEEEANAYIEAARKKYWDARHNCYAFVIGDNNEITRCSDDGEPSSTAGKPILEVITSKQIHNCLVMVTRYFGGTLLGTGGLVRAYQSAARDALDASKLVCKIIGSRITVETDYTTAGKLQYAAEKGTFILEDIAYGAGVTFTFLAENSVRDTLVKMITDITAGKAEIKEEKDVQIMV